MNNKLLRVLVADIPPKLSFYNFDVLLRFVFLLCFLLGNVLFLLYFTSPSFILSYFASLLLCAIRAPTVSSQPDKLDSPPRGYIYRFFAYDRLRFYFLRTSALVSWPFFRSRFEIFIYPRRKHDTTSLRCIVQLNDNDRESKSSMPARLFLSLSLPLSHPSLS